MANRCRILVLVSTALCISAFCGEVNPRSKAKVGDWAEYVFVDATPRVFVGQPKGWKEDRRMILTVTAVTETEITIEGRIKLKTTYQNENGKEVVEEDPDTPMNITRKTDEPLNLPKEHLLPTDEDDALKKTGEGAEDVDIAGKKHKARWVTFDIVKAVDRKESWKLWYDPDGGAFPELKSVCDYGKPFGVQTVTLVARGNKPIEKK